VGFVKPEVVSISGQVQSAGKYTLSTRVDKVSDIVKRSGGLISDAYSEGAFIKRNRNNIDSLKSDESKTSIEQAYNRKFKAQQEAERESLAKTANASTSISLVDPNNQKKKLKDTLDILFKELEEDYYQIAIDINQIIKNPGSELDLVLRDKDEIVIPKMDNKVKISGGVLRPTNIVFEEGLTVRDCVSAAGGVSEYSRRNKAYVIYANGKSARTKYFGLFKISPIIKPGSEVVIPETNSRKDKFLNVTLQYFTVITQLIASLATVKLLTK
jgi:protein involved in polysaccharide export with SLBB domain